MKAVPLPHLLERERPEVPLSIDGPVHVYLQVAGDWRVQLHVPVQVVLHPLGLDCTFSVWVAALLNVAIEDTKIENMLLNLRKTTHKLCDSI